MSDERKGDLGGWPPESAGPPLESEGFTPGIWGACGICGLASSSREDHVEHMDIVHGVRDEISEVLE